MYYVIERMYFVIVIVIPDDLYLRNIQIRNLISDYFLFLVRSLCLVTVITVDMRWIKKEVHLLIQYCLVFIVP